MPCQVFRGPRAGAEQVGEARKHRGVLDQEREIGAAAADRLEQHEQPDENLLWLPGLRRHAQELWQERIEALPRGGRQLQIARAAAYSRELSE